MAISFGSSANNFGTFLGTVNSARSAHSPSDSFDIEAAAKQALAVLVSGSSPAYAMNDMDLRKKLGISEEQFSKVIEHLQNAEMIVPPQQTGPLVKLTDFAAEALRLFDVS